MISKISKDIIAEANQLLDSCEYVQAIKLYKEFLRRNKYNVEALVSISTCYRQLHFLEESLRYIEQALKRERKYIHIYSNYAAILIDLGRIDDGIKCLEDALFEMNLIERDYPLAFNNLAYAYVQKENYDTAIFHYENAIDCDYMDECTLARINLGNLFYHRLNNKKAAFKHYEHAALLGNAIAQALLYKYKGHWYN